MIRCTIDDRIINVRWHYTNEAKEIITTCKISDDTVEGKIVDISTGKTWKANHDTHCKETARKISLQRALRNGGFNRAQRATIWAAYHNRKNKQLSTPEAARDAEYAQELAAI